MTPLPLDPHHDLLALRKRVAQYGDIDDELKADYNSKKNNQPVQGFWGRMSSYLLSVGQLTKSRRRVFALDESLGAFLSASSGRFHSLADLIGAWGLHLEAREVALSESYDKKLREGRAAYEMDKAEMFKEVRSLRHLVQIERSVRQKAFSDFDRALQLLGGVGARKVTPDIVSEKPQEISSSPSQASLVQSFYHFLEERFRGTRDEIKQRLLIYRADLLDARKRVGSGKTFIDLGCGRGEFLEVALDAGIEIVIGVDSNETQLTAAREKGLPVVNKDVLGFLREQREGSALAITGIHIVEHLPFPTLLLMLQETARVLHPHGVVIFETPNPRNLIVGASTFNLDPTHVKPLPPEVLSIALEVSGFHEIDLRLLHPSSTYTYMVEERHFDRDVAALLYGAQDYALVATFVDEKTCA